MSRDRWMRLKTLQLALFSPESSVQSLREVVKVVYNRNNNTLRDTKVGANILDYHSVASTSSLHSQRRRTRALIVRNPEAYGRVDGD